MTFEDVCPCCAGADCLDGGGTHCEAWPYEDCCRCGSKREPTE